jgi:sialic acid synthase SpsE
MQYLRDESEKLRSISIVIIILNIILKFQEEIIQKMKSKENLFEINEEEQQNKASAEELPSIVNSTDLNSLSSMKVSEIQDQLRKYNASTKGSKAQLIQRLVRYICLFNQQTIRSTDLNCLSEMKASYFG